MGWLKGLLAAALTVLPLTAWAADAEHGAVLANQWCASCHAVAPGAKSANDQVPSFAAIAQREDLTADHLRTWLQAPHPNMPAFDLARQNIDDLVDYLQSLAKQ